MNDNNDIHVPTMPNVFPKKKRDFPITERENIMRAFNQEKPLWMPNLYQGTQFSPDTTNGDMPATMYDESEDWFGVQYEFSEAQGSNTPTPGMFDEIAEWREKIKWPDMSALDWTAGYKDFQRDETLALCAPYGNGIFERLHIFEGFEQTLVDLISEPEECRAYFERMADYKIEIYNRMNEVQQLDFVIYNDDWGTARAPFFSVELFEETILEPTKRIVAAFQKGGTKVLFHNCGLIENFIPYLVEDIKADALEIQTLNDFKGIIDKYGDKTTLEYHADNYKMYDPKFTPEDAKEYARWIVDNYGAHVCKGSGVFVMASALKEEVFYAFDDELYNYSLEKYKDL